jgi:hypothetical protein
MGASGTDRLQPLLQGSGHFIVFRKATLGLLREHQLAIELHLEDTAFALDQARFNAEAFLNLVRQTGGSGFVVSNYAVFDRNLVGHEASSRVRENVGSRKAVGVG